MDRKFLFKEEQLAYDSLSQLSVEQAKAIIISYITDNRLHAEFADLTAKMLHDYIMETNSYITRFKRDVNALYVESQLGYDVFKNVDINENNWFWYVRLLRDTEEDEKFPKQNFFQPVYLLKRLNPIMNKLDVEKVKNYNEEFAELYQVYVDLCKKYLIEDYLNSRR